MCVENHWKIYGISETFYLRIEMVDLYIYSPSGPPWPVIGRTLPLPLPLPLPIFIYIYL